MDAHAFSSVPLLLLLLSLASLVHCASNISVTINWRNVTIISKTTTTLQLVINPLILGESPIHDEVFRTLQLLHTRHARYASWFPYPLLSVPEIDPPSGTSQCQNVAVNFTAHLSCARGGGVIDRIEFASFGLPSGPCLAYQTNSTCHASASQSIIQSLCVGKQNCSIPATVSSFGDPCPGRAADYRLAVQVTCNPPQRNTYWNFTWFDPPVLDFLNATQGGVPILEFCTSPSWLYKQPEPLHHYPDDPHGRDWDYNTGTQLVDPTCEQIGAYYGRLAAWYTQGGFYDEYGYYHASGHHFNPRGLMWEVLNEMERNTDIQTYTCIYDSVTRHIRDMADPDHEIQFVALAEAYAAQYDDYTYFLNASNHASAAPLDWISYHRYASAPSRTNVTGYEGFFADYDAFFDVVARIERIRMSLSPQVRTTIDEIGVILPNDNDDDATPFPIIYWNACAASFAYLFGNLVQHGIDALGSSQLVGYPRIPGVLGGLDPQYPSVSMVNWTTGVGTARVWLLQMLIEEFGPGDRVVQTGTSSAADVFAQGFERVGGARRVLLVNKRSVEQVVVMDEAVGGERLTVDEASGERPARREKVSSGQLTMAPFAVSVVILPTSEGEQAELEHAAAYVSAE